MIFYSSDKNLDFYDLETDSILEVDWGYSFLPSMQLTSNYIYTLENSIVKYISFDGAAFDGKVDVVSDDKLFYITPGESYAITTKNNNIYLNYLHNYSDWGNTGASNDKNYRTLSGHTRPITSIAASDEQFASGSEDKTIRIWDYYDSKNIATLIGLSSPAAQLKFIPKTNSIISLSQDGSFVTWDYGNIVNSQDTVFSSLYIQKPDLIDIGDLYLLEDKDETDSTLSADDLYYIGLNHFQYFYDTLKAKESFFKSYKRDPKYANALNGLGLMYYFEGNYDSALYFYNNAIKEEPGFKIAINNRADLFFTQQKYSLAFTDYLRIKNLDSVYFSANNWYSLGIKFYNANQYDEAAECYKESFKRDHSYFESLTGISNIFTQTKDTAKTLSAFHSLLSLYPTNDYLFENLATFYFKIAEYDSAVYYQELLTGVLPNYFSGFWSLGWYKIYSKDFPGSIKASDRAIEIGTTNSENSVMVSINKAHALLFNKDFKQAEKIYMEYKDFPWDTITMKDAVLIDFDTFRNAGLVDDEVGTEMKKIEKELFLNN